MNLPKLKIRPTSQQSCARFGGVYHNPAAPIGTWYDERNLCSDMYPNAVARRGRTMAQNIDGNTPTAPIVAMCGGEHPVLLDETGTFWCNGHSVQVDVYPNVEKCLRWSWTIDKSQMRGDVNVTVTPAAGYDTTFQKFNELGLDGDGETVLWDTIWFHCIDEQDPGWEYDKGTHQASWYPCDLSDFNITVTGDNWLDDVKVCLHQYNSTTGLLKPGHTLVRMGALVVDAKEGVWVDAVKLASGDAMTSDDYGLLDFEVLGPYNEITLELCDIDGNPYNGVVVQDFQPAYQEGYWLDTSQDVPVLREWNYLSSAWIKISSTFVRLHIDSYGWADGVKEHDTVHIYAAVPDTVDKSVAMLLNSWHYIYKRIEDELGGVDLVISGIIPYDSMTILPDQDHRTFEISREAPRMDFVVECGNRLWGCRYDEAASINEIYASKLGDPMNWHSFQGLSTDSWTASRGVAAPFTGAAVLDGHPLFFRETSLEKVYPSASGAHQIQTFDLEGVEEGAADSLCVIEDRLYYKSPKGIMVYTGSLPRRISDALCDLEFTGGSGARHQRKYCLSTTMKKASGNENMVLVYDLENGDWHIETDTWTGRAITWKDDLYCIMDGSIVTMAKGPGYGRVQWWAETAPQAIHDESAARSLTEHKWISYFRIRFRFLSNGTPRMPNTLNIYFSYEDGPWELKKSYIHSGADGQLKTYEIAFLPKRKDNFRLRLEGVGPCQIYDVAWRMERSEGGH